MFIPFVFFFNDTATTEIYTLSLHDALPISALLHLCGQGRLLWPRRGLGPQGKVGGRDGDSDSLASRAPGRSPGAVSGPSKTWGPQCCLGALGLGSPQHPHSP